MKSARQMSRPTPPSARTDEWYTLPADFDPLHREFRFTLDACTQPDCHTALTIVRDGGRIFTPEDDGVRWPWTDARVWCNPPYRAENLERWMGKCVREAARAELIVALIPAQVDRWWWHDWIEPGRQGGALEVRFRKGRQRFGWPGAPSGNSSSSGRNPTALIIWRRAKTGPFWRGSEEGAK
jgi:hypothetical protein